MLTRSFWVMSALVVFVSCADKDLLENETVQLSDKRISFGVSKSMRSWIPDSRALEGNTCVSLPSVSDDPTFNVGVEITTKANHSRGIQIIEASDLKEFDVSAYYFKEGKDEAELFFTEEVTDGVNISDNTYYWPEKGVMDFMAVSPIDAVATMPTAGDYNSQNISFDYVIADDESLHNDLMVAHSISINNFATGDAVPLNFKHLLASVRFKVGTMQFIRIDALTLSGVYGGEVTFTYDKNTNAWTNSVPTTIKTYTPDFVDTSGLPEDSEIAGNENNATLFMVPQTLPEGAKITVSYTELLTGESDTGEADISGQIWEAGKDYAYSFNIGTTFDVTIPTPSDQDAHYIMLEMPYKLGGLSSYVSSIKATARFLDDGSNTSSKSGISLKFKEDLSETQKLGFWTDKQYQETITIDSEGNSSSSGIQEIGNIRGDSELNINNYTGTIVLFIEENNGTTHRNGELVFTATLKNGTNVIIGQGNFKQLSPCWNDAGIGVERIESSNAVYPYGFDYTRKVIYRTTGWTAVSAILSWILEWSISSTITADGKFVKFNYGSVGFLGWNALVSIEIDYSALNNVQTVAAGNNGLDNTRALYNTTGNSDIADIEETLNGNSSLSVSSTTGSTEIPKDYAAFIALARNRMYELETVVKSSGEDDAISHNAALYEDSNGEDIIEWYLPSSTEAQRLVETGVGSDAMSPLHGEYWSSTAGSDTEAYAHSYTFYNNTFGSVNENKPRMNTLKVRAVRNKP